MVQLADFARLHAARHSAASRERARTAFGCVVESAAQVRFLDFLVSDRSIAPNPTSCLFPSQFAL
jgi:hypothetical protein